MPRPLAQLTNRSGKTVSILYEKDSMGEDLDLPAIPLARFEDLLARSRSNPARSKRLKAGISQKELASAMGISQPMISKLERPGAVHSKAVASRWSAAIRAILETRRRWKEKPPKTYDDLLEIQAPLLQLAAQRKPRSPVERDLLQKAGDEIASLESMKRIKAPGQRSTPPRRPK